MNTTAVPLPKRDLLRYAALALPVAFAGLPIYIHAPDFYLRSMTVSLTSMGVVILFIRAFDAVQDPVIGFMSDRYQHHRSWIVATALLVLGISFYTLFRPIKDYPLWSFALSVLFATTAFSVLTININSIGSLWSANPPHKTQITSWREGFALAGVLTAAALPALLSLTALSHVLIVLCVLCGGFFLVALRAGRFRGDQPPTVPTVKDGDEAAEKPLSGWREVVAKNPVVVLGKVPFRGFFTAYFISLFASSIPGVLVIFFVRDYLVLEEYLGLFLVLYFLSGALCMPLWHFVSIKVGAERAWLGSMLLAIVAFVWAYALQPDQGVAYALICFASGCALGAELSLPPAILSRLLDESASAEQTSMFFALMNFFAKMALALSSGIVFLILGAGAFAPNMTNSTASLELLSFSYALLPCMIKVMAVYALWSWIRSLKKQEVVCAHHMQS